MGLNSEIGADIARAFDTDLADAVSNFVATRQNGGGDGWAINDGSTPTEAYTGRGVFGTYSTHEISGQAFSITDVKLVCLQSETTGVPMADDIINNMRVLSVTKDPANISYTIQLRGLNVDNTA